MNKIIKQKIKRVLSPQIFVVYRNLKIIFFRLVNKKYFGLENFPLDMFARVAFYKYPFFYDNEQDQKYFAQFYKENLVTGNVFDIASYVKYTAEILSGYHIKSNKIELKINNESLLPVSIPNRFTDESTGVIKISLNEETFTLKGLKQNSFYYLPVAASKENTMVKIESENDFIIGDPISLKQKNKNNKKLVVTIFIDGLSSKIVTKENISKLMPNTNMFFDNGIKFFNCISSSEWTLPSVASISSGLYSINHGVFNPRGKIEVGSGYKMLGEYFHENEYLTAKICSNQRKNPYYGYMKGFDRTIYKMHMRCNEVISAAIEHLDTFKDRDNYLWLSFFDLHHHLNAAPDINAQKKIPLKFHTYERTILNSPFLSFDNKLINWYENEANKLDLYLQILYSYIQQNYNMDEVLISIVSDHGQAYAGNQKELLSVQKLTTPLMFVGGGVKRSISNNIVQNIDYLPTLLNFSGIKTDKKLDGSVIDLCKGGKVRDFSFSESIYPDRKYEASMYSKEHMFYLTSDKKLKNIKDFKIDQCSYKLIRRSDNYDITDKNKNICVQYLEFIEQHVINKRV